MTIKKCKTTKVVEEIQDVLCNICGGSCKKSFGSVNPVIDGVVNGRQIVEAYDFEAVEFKVSWGYGSEHDTRQESGHICETCWYEKVFPLFSISPVTYKGC